MSSVTLLALLVGLLVCPWPDPACGADIVGGRKAGRQQVGFLASLQRQGRHFCGAALVHPRFVLTAASCFGSGDPRMTSVVLGAYDLRRRQEGSRQNFSVEGVSERGYDPRENRNDIMLLQLDREVNLTEGLALLPLPPQNSSVEEGTGCQVAGWGTQGRRGRLSRFPRVLNVTVTPEDQCRSGNLCARVPSGRRGGICQGDGGSPLVCGGLAQGVASFAPEPCGRGPDFYSPVSNFREWIDSVLRPPSPPPTTSSL